MWPICTLRILLAIFPINASGPGALILSIVRYDSGRTLCPSAGGRNAMPRVSVLVNTYNHERFIAQALGSVAEQDFPSTEIETIVVDDGSTDGTPEIVKRFLPRVQYIRKANGGQVSALHAGFTRSSGDIIAFLDGDDWWTKDKISTVVSTLDKYPSIAAVGHGFYEADEQGLVRRALELDSEYHLSFDSAVAARFAASVRTFGGTSKLTMRRLALEQALPVPSDFPFFDNFLFFQAIATSGAILLPQALCYYRLHLGNLYASDVRNEDRLRRKYNLELGLVKHLPRRLACLGVSDEIISAVLESDQLDSDRLRLSLDGGKPWNTFRVESAVFRSSYRNPDLGYRLFKYLVLFLTLLMPPKVFYYLRHWYSERNLRRLRERIVRAPVADPGVVRHTGQNHENSFSR
jgi:glycosyltransferase involved in cell wall biosynthesis